MSLIEFTKYNILSFEYVDFWQTHSLRLGTKKGQRKFWERRISMICLCSKYVKNCNIFGQILNIWVKLILKKNFKFFFQCLALPKDPQSFGSQNLHCPFLVTQYYRRRRLCLAPILLEIWTNVKNSLRFSHLYSCLKNEGNSNVITKYAKNDDAM